MCEDYKGYLITWMLLLTSDAWVLFAQSRRRCTLSQNLLFWWSIWYQTRGLTSPSRGWAFERRAQPRLSLSKSPRVWFDPELYRAHDIFDVWDLARPCFGLFGNEILWASSLGIIYCEPKISQGPEPRFIPPLNGMINKCLVIEIVKGKFLIKSA